MNGSEGGKDSAYSLCSYLEVVLEIIYYEFAINLGEYCMNRKAGYFKNTYFVTISFMAMTIHAPKSKAVRI